MLPESFVQIRSLSLPVGTEEQRQVAAARLREQGLARAQVCRPAGPGVVELDRYLMPDGRILRL